MSRKVRFAADRIAKSFLPQEDTSSSSSSEPESSEETPADLEFIPSRLREDAVPDLEGSGARQVSRTELDSEDISEEEDEENDSDIDFPAPPEMQDLEAELAQLEADEGTSLVESLRAQQEADLKVARGTAALRTQYSSLLLLRLKFQNLLSASNVLPPPLPVGVCPNAFEAAIQDAEVATLLADVNQEFTELEHELHEMKDELQQMYGWETDQTGDQMMEIIRHWGSRLRMSSGFKKGAVINRSVEEQIAAALDNLGDLVQPSKHRDEGDRIFGLEEQLDVITGYYNDYGWYKKLLADFVGEKRSDAKVVERPKKKLLRGKQISYETIPKLQGFMIPSKPVIVPDEIDALYNSLMK
jgi:hypothetical protein